MKLDVGDILNFEMSSIKDSNRVWFIVTNIHSNYVNVVKSDNDGFKLKVFWREDQTLYLPDHPDISITINVDLSALSELIEQLKLYNADDVNDVNEFNQNYNNFKLAIYQDQNISEFFIKELSNIPKYLKSELSDKLLLLDIFDEVYALDAMNNEKITNRGIAGLPLAHLDATDNSKITNRGIRGMPLVTLRADGKSSITESGVKDMNKLYQFTSVGNNKISYKIIDGRKRIK